MSQDTASPEAAPAPAGIPGLTIGRVAHYVEKESPEHYAAMVTSVRDPVAGVSDLVVFNYPFPPDVHSHPAPAASRLAVRYDPAGKEDRSWHWPERA